MSENPAISNKNVRIQYIDALRGFAMLLVVFVHVEIFGFFNFTHTTFLGKLFSAIHMPTFFFISGLCIYKSGVYYTYSRVHNDFMRLILPAAIVGLTYTYFCINQDLIYFLSNSMKAGYWFTVSLFEVLLIYYVIYNLTRSKINLFVPILCLIAVLLYLLKLPLKIFPKAEIIGNYLCLHQTCNYFIFFVLGVIFKKFSQAISRLLKTKWFSTVVILVLVVSSYYIFCVELYLSGTIRKIIETIGETVIGLSGVLLLYSVFEYYKDKFESANFIGKSLLVIGKNTLAIYLLHYFFLPHIPEIGNFLTCHYNFIIELLLGLLFSLLIIALCLCMSNTMKISPFLGKYILGSRN